MNVPRSKINRIAIIIAGILFLSQTVYLILQVFFSAQPNYLQPQPIISGLLTGLMLVISLTLFFVWQKQYRYLLLAFFFFWLSFAVKDIAWYVADEKRVSLEILVTISRMIMSAFLATGIFQGEVSKLLTRQENTNKKDKVV